MPANAISMINTLRAQKIIVYPDGEAITNEPKKIANDAYRLIGVTSPVLVDTKSAGIEF